jgi:cytochrome b subunit of formate dehydrogenase
VLLHWGLVLTLVLSLATGLRISADAPDSVLSRMLSPILMQGEVTHTHLLSAYGLIALVVGYVVFLWRARLGSRVALSLHGIDSPSRDLRWRAINRLVYWLAFLLLIAAGVSGTLLHFFPGLLPTRALVLVHEFVAWSLIAYLGVHVLAQLALGGPRQLLKILSPRAAYGGAAALALGSSVVAVGGVLYPLDQSRIQALELARISEAPVLDGDPGDAVWARTKAVELHTNQGLNLPGGEVKVRVRGAHDRENAYLLFEWQDPSRSQKHLPLVKTAEGWKVMESKYGINDENDYYEDKFAVMLSRSAKPGGGATQMGPKPLDDKPAPQHGRGLHYTTDGGIEDVWHWKSVRTGPLGQFDDNYFGPPMNAEDPKKRYTGGYNQDPKTAGGFEQNWKKIEGSKFVQPKFLPKDMAALQAKMGKVNLDPSAHDEGQFWMALADTVPYTKELDTYPVGTVLPSVLIDKPFEGDRGEVAGVATWKDGWWRMEARRRLETGSLFDLPIEQGTYLWVAVFDHNQARHTRHNHPLRLQLEN